MSRAHRAKIRKSANPPVVLADDRPTASATDIFKALCSADNLLQALVSGDEDRPRVHSH